MESRKTIMEFLGGRSGVYALDCRRPFSQDYPHQLFADYTYEGKLSGMIVGMRLNIEDNGYTTGFINSVELQNRGELLAYFVQTVNDRYSFVWKKAGEEAISLYQFEDETRHIAYVKDGVIPNTAVATPIYLHCRRSLFPLGQAW